MTTDLTARIAAGEADNAEVLTALGWKNPERWYWVGPKGQHLYLKGEYGDDLPEPLDSVDDALRLVPEGWMTFNVEQYADEWEWTLMRSRIEYREGCAPTAARALTIAILRAKETNHD